ncbi:MAG TPA: orotate phosphoribosyltransferase [Actinomycetota bacterium]
MTPEEALRLLEAHGAVSRGHFKLSSGRHSDLYVQKARIFEQPEATMAVARAMASWYPHIDVVVAPAVGAIPLGFAVALAAGARSLFAEREDGRMQLRRGFHVTEGEKALVVEDVVTTGASAREVFELLGEFEVERLGVAALVDRTTSGVGFPLRALVRVDASSWDQDECPLCRESRPFDSPGSRHLQRSG